VRGLISFVVVAVTVIVQLTVVDRIAFPGGAGPDLVLLAVAALALANGPLTGMLTGFWGGLALDVAPPGSHFVGQDALVFCLIGYACGLLADDSSGDAAAEQGHTALFEILVTAAGAVCGEVLAALLGVMLSDPRVTWPAIRNVLPAAVVYDVLLCPFVLYAVAAALRLAGARGEGRRVGWSASQARTPVPGANQGAIRQLAGGNGPRLRLSDRDKGPGAIGGLRGPGAGRPAARREPRLKLGRAAPRTSVAAYRAGHGAGGAKVRFGSRRREGVLGGSLLGGASPGGSALRSSALAGSALRGSSLRGSGLRGSGLRGSGLGSSGLRGSSLRSSGLGNSGLGGSRFASSSMGRSLLGGSVFSRSSSPRALSSAFGRSAPLGRSSPLRHRGNLMRSASGGLAGRTPRFSRGGSVARLTGALRGSAGPKSPGRGWLRGASARGHSLGGNSLGGSSLGRKSLGRSSLGRKSLGRKSLGHKSLGGKSLGRGAFGRRKMGRALRRSRVWAGPGTPRLKAARTGSARLRMPRPKAKRRWRTGGYR
jgi:rod shape-determining protein MreD